MPSNPFHTAEEYIRLRNKCASPAWVDTIMRFNELIIAPIITLFLVLCGQSDLFALLSSTLTVYNAWSEWIKYNNLKLEVQQLFLTTMVHGGPQIVTNDPDYMPYVYADAVFRLNERRPHP